MGGQRGDAFLSIARGGKYTAQKGIEEEVRMEAGGLQEQKGRRLANKRLSEHTAGGDPSRKK